MRKKLKEFGWLCGGYVLRGLTWLFMRPFVMLSTCWSWCMTNVSETAKALALYACIGMAGLAGWSYYDVASSQEQLAELCGGRPLVINMSWPFTVLELRDELAEARSGGGCLIRLTPDDIVTVQGIAERIEIMAQARYGVISSEQLRGMLQADGFSLPPKATDPTGQLREAFALLLTVYESANYDPFREVNRGRVRQASLLTNPGGDKPGRKK